MKKLVLKNISFLLVLIIILTIPSNIYAESINKHEFPNIKLKMEQEIEKEIDLARQEIYKQLKDQDALILMKVYEDIIYPQIDDQIRAEYNELYNMENENVKSSSRKSYYAPNGGIVTYLSNVSGYKPTEVAVTALNQSDSYDLVLKMGSFTISDIVGMLLGYNGNIGAVSSTVLNIKSIAKGAALESIRKNGRCAKVINTYSRQWGTKASLVTGWSDRFYIRIPSNSRNVKFIRY